MSPRYEAKNGPRGRAYFRLRELMLERAKKEGRKTPLTFLELAEATGLPRRTLNAIGNQAVLNPTLSVLLTLYEYFELSSWDELIAYEPGGAEEDEPAHSLVHPFGFAGAAAY